MGLYTDSGLLTCTAAGPGSYGHYPQDAKTFASWGMDYVKMDWCYTVVDDVQLDPRIAYHNMSIALNQTGRPIFFNLCEQGILSPWEWGPSCGNSWRTGADHHDTWDVSYLFYHLVLSLFFFPFAFLFFISFLFPPFFLSSIV